MKGSKNNAESAAKAATPIDEIPSDLEIPVSLRSRSKGNYRNQFRGWLDKAGTVRVRVYHPTDPTALRGEIITVRESNLDFSTPMEGKPEVSKFVFELDDDDVTIVAWVPTELEFDSVTVIL